MSTSFTNLQAIPIDGALPIQNTATAGKALISNGTNVGWNTVLSMIGTGAGQTPGATVARAILPIQTGSAGKILSTDGLGNLSWQTDAGAIAGVSSVSISGTVYTGAVVITNVPSATTANNVTGVVSLANGGTGATSATLALASLGAAAVNHTHNYAPLTDPAFAGTPTAPTAAVGTNSTQLATTAFINAAITAATPGIVAEATPTSGAVGTYMWWATGSTPYAVGATVPAQYPGSWVSRGPLTTNTYNGSVPGNTTTYFALVQRVA